MSKTIPSQEFQDVVKRTGGAVGKLIPVSKGDLRVNTHAVYNFYATIIS